MGDAHRNGGGLLPPRPRRYTASDLKTARATVEALVDEHPELAGYCPSLTQQRNVMQAEYERLCQQWVVDSIVAIAEHVGMQLPDAEQDVDYVGVAVKSWKNDPAVRYHVR